MTVKQFVKKMLHVLCLIVPLLCAALGIYAAPHLWKFCSETGSITPEWFKFITSAVCFAVPALVIFLLTRNENTIFHKTLK